jgi:hypothetical protein
MLLLCLAHEPKAMRVMVSAVMVVFTVWHGATIKGEVLCAKAATQYSENIKMERVVLCVISIHSQIGSAHLRNNLKYHGTSFFLRANNDTISV